jgi:RimJ/RimL family protein N-acetyltransferase
MLEENEQFQRSVEKAGFSLKAIYWERHFKNRIMVRNHNFLRLVQAGLLAG